MPKQLERTIAVLFIVSTSASFLSATTLIGYILLGLLHADVSYEGKKSLFVLGTMLGTLAEGLEVLLVIPLFRKVRDGKGRTILILALIPYVNLFVALTFLVVWLRERTKATRRQLFEAAKNPAMGLPGQIAAAPAPPRNRKPAAATAATTPTASIASVPDGSAAALVGAGTLSGTATARTTSATAPPAQSSLQAVLTNAFGTNAASAIIDPSRRALPVLVASTLAVAATAPSGAVAVISPAPLLSSPPPSLASVASGAMVTPVSKLSHLSRPL